MNRGIACLIAGSLSIAAQARPPGLDTVLERFRAYLTSYSEQYSATVSIERYRQRDGPVDRVLESEFAMVRVPTPEKWLGFRDVLRVDGADVTGRAGRLAAIFATPSALSLDIAARIAAESARYNIGPSRRTVNNPALVLLVLDPQNHHRFRFSKRGESRVAGIRTWDVNFVEESRPTIVRTSDGLHDQPIDGRAWIDPGKGTLVRALMRIHVYSPERPPPRSARPPTTLGTDHYNVPVPVDRGERVILEVNFAFDTTAALWVPVRMREQHELGTRTLQSGEATYSGYRKFGVQSRILPNP